MMTVWFILLMGYLCPKTVDLEVYFVRAMGRENESDIVLTQENVKYIDEMNEYLAVWYEKHKENE